MEIPNKEDLYIHNQNTLREIQFEEEGNRQLEVPSIGNDDLNRVTKISEPYDLSGSLCDDNGDSCEEERTKPGLPLPSVDHLDDTGIDSTREPDWEVIEKNNLSEEPRPEDLHNDRYWDERSLDREISDKDFQDKFLEEKQSDSDRQTVEADEFSRPYRNETLDPYYNSSADFNHHNSS